MPSLEEPQSLPTFTLIKPLDIQEWAYMKKGVAEGRAVVLSVEHNFHGRTLGVISLSVLPGPTFELIISPAAQIPIAAEALAPTSTVSLLSMTAAKSVMVSSRTSIERALELHGRHVTAFLVEPIQGEAK
ncbi:hypothetical protein SCLCIDRAFT_1118102 [Scleroderma citrinum Foug A]|uniref:Ornithine aminotransferase n=1 Tax=Scleroderma citrinum Foug A TaxID=1036808 RepID=A0A0C2Z766_9AGAM|nr:hypothetical protein SCLCIDRAFT_1118102 [Scleroderma citrinum Foug A]